jgi:hypothetical protein
MFDTSDYDEIRSMKRADSYRFSYPVEYIIDRIGDENSNEYVIGNTTIDVQLDWRDSDDSEAPGYRVSYKVNNYGEVPIGFNGSEYDMFDQIYSDLQIDMSSAGIDVRAVETF